MSLVLQSSGGGSVTVQEPTTASNFTATLPAATGTVMVSGNMPAFSAYQNSAQGAISSATDVKVLFDTEEFDTNNNFASSRFTPTVAGYYQLNFCVRVDGGPSRIILNLFKNGSIFKGGNDIAASPVRNVGSTLVYADGSTDYFEVYVYASGGTPTLSSTGTFSIYFNGAMVRSA
jgi:hypothetical protein